MDYIEKLKEVPVSWAWLVVFILGASFSFYWFSARPASIRKACDVQAVNSEGSYADCLIQNGI